MGQLGNHGSPVIEARRINRETTKQERRMRGALFMLSVLIYFLNFTTAAPHRAPTPITSRPAITRGAASSSESSRLAGASVFADDLSDLPAVPSAAAEAGMAHPAIAVTSITAKNRQHTFFMFISIPSLFSHRFPQKIPHRGNRRLQ